MNGEQTGQRSNCGIEQLVSTSMNTINRDSEIGDTTLGGEQSSMET